MQMDMKSFLIIAVAMIVSMAACRVIPLFALKGRSIPPKVEQALNLIPPAAFAALVANDLLSPTMFEGGLLPGLVPLIAALITMVVGYWKKSLVLCILVGVGCYAAMTLLML